MIKREYQNTSAFDFFFFNILSASKMLLFQELRCVTAVILSHFDGFVSSNVLYVTEQIVTQRRRLVKFSVSKLLKLTQFHLFTPLFDRKSIFVMGKRTRRTKNEPLGCKYLLLCISKLEVFTQLPPAYLENSPTSMMSSKDFLP